MRVAKVDGLVTLLYDRSKELNNRELIFEWVRACRSKSEDALNLETLDLSDECKRYIQERLYWQQIIVVDDITEIPEFTFYGCFNIKRVIFADTVIRIKRCAFLSCKNLVSIKWSLRIEYIDDRAFNNCNLSSVFIPPSCRNIGKEAFARNKNLTILNVSQDTQLDNSVIRSTKLCTSCPQTDSGEINTLLKNVQNHENFALHRVCSSFEPTLDMIVNTMMDKGGLSAFKVENGIGITPSRYLKENPFTSVKEMEIIQKYFLKMIGEL